MDRIVERWNVDCPPERPGMRREFMPLTSLVFDALAADSRTVLVGPFTQRQPPARNRKEHAKEHSDQLLGAQWLEPYRRNVGDAEPVTQHDRLFAEWAAAHIWPEGKTYTLRSPHKPGLANEYGGHNAHGHGPRTSTLLYGTPEQRRCVQPNGVGHVIQPEAYAHSYSRFQDYFMMCMLMGAHGWLDDSGRDGPRFGLVPPAKSVDLRHLLADPERAHLVTVHGAQDWHTLAGPL